MAEFLAGAPGVWVVKGGWEGVGRHHGFCGFLPDFEGAVAGAPDCDGGDTVGGEEGVSLVEDGERGCDGLEHEGVEDVGEGGGLEFLG